MLAHRFREQLATAARSKQSLSTGFIACPTAVLPPNSEVRDAWRELHRRAFEQAQTVDRPSWPDRSGDGVWN